MVILVYYVNSGFIVSRRNIFSIPFLAESAKMLVHVLFFHPPLSFSTTAVRLCNERHRGLTWKCMKNCYDDETILDDFFHEIRREKN